VRLTGICADIGIEMLPITATVRAGQTTAASTLQSILDDHGEGHLIQLLRTFVETENRRARIDAFALRYKRHHGRVSRVGGLWLAMVRSVRRDKSGRYSATGQGEPRYRSAEIRRCHVAPSRAQRSLCGEARCGATAADGQTASRGARSGEGSKIVERQIDLG
jgi:hypothetical protein